MCFGKPKLPKAQPAPTLAIPQTTPIQQQLPTTQSGADVAAQTQTPKKKSLFQIDLTIPTGAGTGTTVSPTSQDSSQTGANT